MKAVGKLLAFKLNNFGRKHACTDVYTWKFPPVDFQSSLFYVNNSDQVGPIRFCVTHYFGS